jgi:hypothetical protein
VRPGLAPSIPSVSCPGQDRLVAEAAAGAHAGTAGARSLCRHPELAYLERDRDEALTGVHVNRDQALRYAARLEREIARYQRSCPGPDTCQECP